MISFGKFLELSIPTPDIQASLGFYRDLGFVELPTGDIRTQYYAVVTDGRIAIGLHGGSLEQPALSFVQSDVAARVRELEAAGIEMQLRRLGVQEFNEASFYDPDENLVMLLEAPTFSPIAAEQELRAPAVGQTLSIRMASRRPEETIDFWVSHGFARDDDGDLYRLLAPGLVLELDSRARGILPTLTFRCGDTDYLYAVLERSGIEATAGAREIRLTAPEGTRLAVLLD